MKISAESEESIIRRCGRVQMLEPAVGVTGGELVDEDVLDTRTFTRFSIDVVCIAPGMFSKRWHCERPDQLAEIDILDLTQLAYDCRPSQPDIDHK